MHLSSLATRGNRRASSTVALGAPSPQTPEAGGLCSCVLVVMVQCLLLLRTPPPNSGHQGAGEAPPLAPPAKLAWSTSLSTFRPAPPGPGVPQCQCLRLKLRNVASFSAFTLGGRVPGLAVSLLSASPPAEDRLLPMCPAQWGTREQGSCGQGTVYICVHVYVWLWGAYACLCMSMSVCL